MPCKQGFRAQPGLGKNLESNFVLAACARERTRRIDVFSITKFLNREKAKFKYDYSRE